MLKINEALGRTPLEFAISLVGGVREMAKLMNVQPSAITNWRRRRVPPERCAEIERLTLGLVTRSELRPDVFGTLKELRKQATSNTAVTAPSG